MALVLVGIEGRAGDVARLAARSSSSRLIPLGDGDLLRSLDGGDGGGGGEGAGLGDSPDGAGGLASSEHRGGGGAGGVVGGGR